MTLSNLSFTVSGNNLIITDGVVGDSIDIQNQFNESSLFQVQTLRFADGSTMSLTGGLPLTASGNGGWDGTGFGDTLIGGSGTEILYESRGNNTLIAGQGTETLEGGGGTTAYQVQTLRFSDGTTLNLTANAVAGTGNGSFAGSTGNDLILGGQGTETLNGGGGNDTFFAGRGAETLSGGAGNDVYVYAQGDGVDTISDSGGTNSLILGSSLTIANVLFLISGNDLLLTDGTAGDTIDLHGQYGGHPIQSLVFGDGSTLALGGTAPTIGTAGATLSTSGAGATLIAGPGNETLTGTGGGDTFIGGAGTDTLTGAGNDTFLVDRDAGQETIVEGGGNNTVQFGAGIAQDQLWFAQQGNDLLVSVIGTAQTIDIQGWYATPAQQNETFEMSDGAALLNRQVQNLINAMASLAPPALGQTSLPMSESSQLEPIIAANWH